MAKFVILKDFDVKIHTSKTPILKEILWHPPIVSWIKYNSGGAVHGSCSSIVYRGVFRDYQTNFLRYYASNIEICFAIHVEFMRSILAIEIDFVKSWTSSSIINRFII